MRNLTQLAPLVAAAILWTEASPRASDDVLPHLVFARQQGDLCSIETWHPVEIRPRVLATSIGACPENLFVSNKTLLFQSSDTIREIPIVDRDSESKSQQLPALDFDAYRNDLSTKPDDDALALTRSRELTVVALGYLPDGQMGLQARLEMVPGDTFNYLFGLNDGTWTIQDAIWCDRSDKKCEFPSLQTRTARPAEWLESQQIWHNDIRKNPYFVKEDAFSIPNDAVPIFGTQLVFRIGTGQTQLNFANVLDFDSATPQASAVELIVDGKPSKPLSESRCLTSLVDRFVLVEDSAGSLNLWSLESGESVFGPLVHAVWTN